MIRPDAMTVALAAFGFTAAAAHAQVPNDVIRIGFITDLSGPYADLDGPAGAEAIRMAVADMGGTVAGKPVEVLTADHGNKVEVAAAMAREFLGTDGVDVLIGGVNSGTSLAMAEVAAEKKKPFIVVGAGNTEHTNEQCSPYTVQYAYNTAAQGKVLGGGVVKAGGKSWYFLTPDHAFGAQMRDSAVAAVNAGGGTIAGSATHPSGAGDFSSFLQQAQGSKAGILGLASGHTDLVATVRAANALGVTRTMKLAGAFVFIDEVHALGLEAAQGMHVTDSWFWSRDAETKAWARRFFDKFDRMPSSLHAADYSAALQYLTAVEAVDSDDGDEVLAHMKTMKINDVFAKNGSIRDDGLMVHDMYLLQVKSPEKSTEPWDYYDLVGIFQGDAAWTAEAESTCEP